MSNSATYIRFTKWADANDSYGEVIEAMATNRVDFGLAFFYLNS